MNLAEFIIESSLLEKSEIEKVRLLSFFFLITSNKVEFSINDINDWFNSIQLAKPNSSRLRKNILKSLIFCKRWVSFNL